jgi:hypothetical protein
MRGSRFIEAVLGFDDAACCGWQASPPERFAGVSRAYSEFNL